MMCGYRFLICSLLLLPISASASDWSFGEWAYDYFVDGATVKIGVGTRQAGVRVTRLADDAEGRVVQRDEESYFLTYSTSPIYTSLDNIGLTVVFNLSSFRADQQEIARDQFEDIGSRVSGRFFYVVPTAFYEWGNYRSGTFARVGVGVGLGVARFDGNAFLTSTPGNDEVVLAQSGTEWTAAGSVVIEGHWNNFGLTFNVAGPSYETDAYEYGVEDISVYLGYQFVF